MTNSLTNYSNKDEVAVNKAPFQAFIKLFNEINPNLTKADIILIKECISDDKITVGELDKAVKLAYKDPDRYGKVEYNHVWKWIKRFREDKGFNPEAARNYQNAFK